MASTSAKKNADNLFSQAMENKEKAPAKPAAASRSGRSSDTGKASGGAKKTNVSARAINNAKSAFDRAMENPVNDAYINDYFRNTEKFAASTKAAKDQLMKGGYDKGLYDSVSGPYRDLAVQERVVSAWLRNNQAYLDPAVYDEAIGRVNEGKQAVVNGLSSISHKTISEERQRQRGEAWGRQRREEAQLAQEKKREREAQAAYVQSMAQQTEQAYQAYLASDEYKTSMLEAGRITDFSQQGVEDAGRRMLDNSKLRELEAQRDYWKDRQRQEQDRQVSEQDMDFLQAMPRQDREALERYVTGRTVDFYNTVGPQTGEPSVSMGRAELEAQPLFEKYGFRRVQELAETVQRMNNAQNAQAAEQDAKENAQGVLGGIGSTLGSMGANLVGTGSTLAGYAREAGFRTGRYSTLDPNNEGNLLGTYSKSARGAVAENIAGGEDGNGLRRLAAGAYTTVLSAADSILRNTAFGPGSLVMAGLNAAGETLQEASEKGATPTQAVILAAANGASEVLTEKIPLDDWLETVRAGKQPLGKAIFAALKQGGIEATTEEVNLAAGLLSEALVLRENAGYNRQVTELIAGGMSPREAKAIADKQLWQEAAVTAAQSAASGALTSAGGSILGALNAKRNGATMETTPQDTAQSVPAAQEAGIDPNQMPIDQPGTASQAAPAGADTSFIDQAAQDILNPKPNPLENAPDMQWAADNVFGVAEDVTQAKAGQDIEGTGLELEKDFQDYPYNKQTVIKGYEDSVDQNVLEFVKEVQSGKNTGANRVTVGQVNDKMAADIMRETGVDGKAGNDIILNTDRVSHITKRHGENGTHDKSMSNPEDIARINYVLQNYDGCKHGDETSWVFRNRDGTPGETIKFWKKINGTYFVVEAVPDTSKTWIVSAYMNKKGVPQEPDAKPRTNVQNGAANTPGAPQVLDAGDGPSPHVQNVLASTPMEAETKLIGELPNTALIATSNSPASTPSIQYQNGDVKGNTGESQESRVGVNTFANAESPDIRAMGEDIRQNAPELNRYQPQTEAGQNAQAEARTATPEKIRYERENLLQKGQWDASDVKTSMRVMEDLRKSGDAQGFRELYGKLRAQQTNAGQMVQAMAEYTRGTPMGAVQAAMDQLDTLGKEGIDPKFYKKQGYEQWSKSVQDTIVDVSNKLDAVKDGDTDGMRDIVQQLAQFRHTTAWLGYTDHLSWDNRRKLKSLDYKTLRGMALSQLSMVTADFRKRSKAEKLNTVRINNMLASFKTTNRNFQGNTVQGFADSVSDSGAGQLADCILGKFTGVRTTGADIAHPGAYLKAAAKAWDFATLCIDLDIPTDSPGAYDYGNKVKPDGGSTNTFTMQGGPMERFFAGYTAAMKYALDATDSVFYEGAKASTIESLNALGEKSGLTDMDKEAIADLTAKRRTYKDERRLTRFAKKTKEAANELSVGGIGLGDVAMPFPGVPSSVAHTAIDYSGFGIVEGLGEMVSVAKDARGIANMNESQRTDLILRQKKAVSDFGRGVTGASLIALAAVAAKHGCVRYSSAEDRDQENADLNQYQEGVQVNWSSLHRVLSGQDGAEQDGDLVSGMDSLSQFESLFAIASIWAQDGETPWNKAKMSASAMYDAILNMPAMQGMADIQEYITNAGSLLTGEDDEEKATAAGNILGDAVSGAYPAIVRNIAQAKDPIIRDTSDTDPLKAGANRVMAAMPGLSETLPAKIDPLTGMPQRRDETQGEAFWNRLLAPDAWHRRKENPVTGYLDGLYEKTGDASIYPDSKAPASFRDSSGTVSIDGKEATERYQQVYSDFVSRKYGELTGDEGFRNLPPEAQAERLKAIQDQGRKRAQLALSDTSGFTDRAREELLRLNEATGSSGVFFRDMDQHLSYTDTTGKKQERQLTDEEFTTVRDTKRRLSGEILDRAANLGAYLDLSDTERNRFVKYAYEYAEEQAKRAGISDYYADPGSWTGQLGRDAAYDIALKVRGETLSRAMDSLFDDRKRGFDTEESAQALSEAYDSYRSQKGTEREKIKDSAVGNTAKMLEIRDNGVSHEDYMKVTQAVSDAVGTGKISLDTHDRALRDIDIREAIAKAGLSEEKTDTVMRAYMADYAAPSLDYDVFRDQGFTDADFRLVSDTLEDIRGTGTKNKATGRKKVTESDIRRAVSGLGYDKDETDLIVEIYLPDSQTTEPKYDTVRDMGFSPAEYVDTYRAYLDSSGKKNKISAIQEACGCDYSTAQTLYNLYGGSWAPWES